jgi:hypothetical protein
MIARIWRGVVRREDRDAYADYIRDTGLAGYEATPATAARGCCGATSAIAPSS